MQMPARKEEEIQSQAEFLYNITKKINEGITLEDVLNFIFDTFNAVIPYDRIGVAFIEKDGKNVVAHWAKTKAKNIILENGYSAPLKGSTLENILKLKKPRILNDLPAYLHANPNSESTKKIIAEGMISSLTCPLIIEGKYIGFIFFSSMYPNTYKNLHSDFFQQIAGQLSVIIEKGRLYDRIMDLNELKTKFLGIAAHDLRNPINVIKGNVDLIKEGIIDKNSDEFPKTLDTIKKHCESMLNIINTFLSISVIESGKLDLKKEKTKIDQFLSECAEYNSLLAKSKSINLELKNENNLPEINIDRERIKQVINNLISNSIKYSETNTLITLKSYKKDNFIEIAVIDKGQGIPKEEISKLFEFFSKTSTKPTGKESSTGFGLAISKKIVEAHGGKIWAENNPDKGLTITFSLPISA